MTRSINLLVLALLATAATGEPLLTGVIEDSRAQTVEMPSLPGAWQRRIEWMAPEGSEVVDGDMIVQLDPGELISQEEQTKTDLDKARLTAERRVDELRLEVLDAERAVAEAASSVRLAELDAVIPETTIPKLDYDRYQLTLDTARKALIRAEATLLNKRNELEDVSKETQLDIEQAESTHQFIEAALDATEILAEKSGYVIYGENPFTGKRIYPGETLFAGFKIASVSSREDLQVRFWIHEADILQLQTGQLVEVIADAQSASPFLSRIVWTSRQAIERQDWSDSGYFEALAEPTNGIPDDVMPGMSVMVRASPFGEDR